MMASNVTFNPAAQLQAEFSAWALPAQTIARKPKFQSNARGLHITKCAGVIWPAPKFFLSDWMLLSQFLKTQGKITE